MRGKRLEEEVVWIVDISLLGPFDGIEPNAWVFRRVSGERYNLFLLYLGIIRLAAIIVTCAGTLIVVH